jgi:transporter family-2 protein
MWIGGLLGALFVFTTIFSVPKLGAGLMIVLIIAGQMACAIAMDHYGFLVEERSVSLMRIAGAGLVMAGAWLVYKG